MEINWDALDWGLSDGEKEMTQGYLDGFDGSSPDPGLNRGRAYKHGFANGRDDLSGHPRSTAQVLRDEADRILAGDV